MNYTIRYFFLNVECLFLFFLDVPNESDKMEVDDDKIVILWSTINGYESYFYPTQGSAFFSHLCYQFNYQSKIPGHEVNLWTAYKATEISLSNEIIKVGNLDGSTNQAWQIPESVGMHPFTFRKVNQENRCRKVVCYDYNVRQSNGIVHFVNNFDQGTL